MKGLHPDDVRLSLIILAVGAVAPAVALFWIVLNL